MITKYKTGRIPKSRLYKQLILWIAIFIVIAGSFPLYNHLSGKAIFESSSLTLFDITQTTVIILLIYVLGTLHQRIENNEKRLRDLHQELSIQLSKQLNEKSSKR